MDFENIQTIKIRKPFPAIVGVDILVGMVAGGVLAVGYLMNDAKSDNPSFPPFGRKVLTGMAPGTGLGFVCSVGEGLISIRIPVNRGKYISEMDKTRLQNYLGIKN